MTQSDGAEAKAEVRKVARTAGNSKALEIPARIGFAASGLVQILLGILAIQMAANHFGEADQSVAFAEVSKVPGGIVVLWICVIGLFALALWLLIQAMLFRGDETGKLWARRLRNLSKAAAYSALGFTALTFAEGHSTHASSSTRHLSERVFTLPGGPVLLVIVGLVAIGVGGYFLSKGIRRTFTRDIVLPNGAARVAMLVLGVAGYVAKGLLVAVGGLLFIVSAVRAQPATASGLSGAFESLAQLPLGVFLLLAIGAGLIASGVYNALRAWLARF